MTIPEPIPHQRPLRGKARVLANARQAEIERQALEAELIRDLGHEPSATERVAVEVLSAQIVRSRKMRANGRQAEAEMAERLILRGLGKLGIRSAPAKPPSIEEMLRARGHLPPVAPKPSAAAERHSDATRASEAAP